jgi:hypothetical protein
MAVTLKLAPEFKDRVAARRNFMRTGKAYAFEDVRKYFTARIAGKPAGKPRLKQWRV